MIIIKLSDGLGNQLFQYAFGRRLALKNDDTLKLDLSWYERRDAFGGTERTVSLDSLNVVFNPATEKEIADIISSKVLVRLFRQHGHILEYAPRLPARCFDYYRQIMRRGPDNPSWPYRRRWHPAVLDVEGDVYIDGYWQSYRYVQNIRDVLLDEFTVSNPLTGANLRTAERIDETTAVGVHVRRGDQLGRGPEDDEFGNAERPGYYDRASTYIVDNIDASDLHVFVFSDDPEWCRTGLEFDHPTTVVDHNDGSTDYEDFRLLRRCDHHIIASSTFSWWGAWLCENDEQLVTYPTPWKRYGYPDGILEEWDLIPPDWTPIDDY